jgi:hypothetical protein
MVIIDIDARYVGLQAPISIPKATQVTTVVGRVPLMLANMVIIGSIGRDPNNHDSDPHSVDDEFVGSSSLKSDG